MGQKPGQTWSVYSKQWSSKELTWENASVPAAMSMERTCNSWVCFLIKTKASLLAAKQLSSPLFSKHCNTISSNKSDLQRELWTITLHWTWFPVIPPKENLSFLTYCSQFTCYLQEGVGVSFKQKSFNHYCSSYGSDSAALGHLRAA